MEGFSYRYRFLLPGGELKEFEVRLDPETFALVRPERDSWPEWTALAFCRCPNCPIDEKSQPRCPVAEGLVEVVEYFKGALSTDTTGIEVSSETRKISKRASMSDGIGAVIGMVMVSCGCPIMDRLRPMLRTHLPFSTIDETLYRTFTMYLLAQYFIARRGGTADWAMGGLPRLLEDVQTVNRSFCKRLHGTCIRDASVNALVHLDSFTELTNLALLRKKGRLDRLERSFAAYLEGLPTTP